MAIDEPRSFGKISLALMFSEDFSLWESGICLSLADSVAEFADSLAITVLVLNRGDR